MRVKPFLVAAGTASSVAAAVGTVAVVRPWYRRWGRDETEAAMPLPGDDLVADPTGQETRAITISAPPERVWPWLVQMGYGRGGWYSYDALDMRGSSATTIRPDLQSIAPGDLMPTFPGGGFVVRIVRPDEALVLTIDGETVRRQAEAARLAATAGVAPVEPTPAGLRASAAMLGTQPSDFSATWAFVLRPLEDGGTRLVQRFRIRYGEIGLASRLTGPVLGFGVFLMMRRQLLGIRDRVERLAADDAWWTAHPLPGADLPGGSRIVAA